jgi:hypothetical protein
MKKSETASNESSVSKFRELSRQAVPGKTEKAPPFTTRVGILNEFVRPSD